MSVTKTDIANLALGRLGASLVVVDFDNDNTQQAKIIRRHFRAALDTVLEMHPWNCADKTAALTLVTAFNDYTTGFGWGYSYTVPADCLVVRELAMEGIFPREDLLEDEKVKWEEKYNAGGTMLIYTDCQTAYANYTVRLDEDLAFPTHLGRAVAAQLAMDIAPQLITNNFAKVEAVLNKNAQNEIHKSIASDLGRQPRRIESPSPFHRARLY